MENITYSAKSKRIKEVADLFKAKKVFIDGGINFNRAVVDEAVKIPEINKKMKVSN